jgi:hypothetical protein
MRPALAAAAAFVLCLALTLRSSAADVAELIPSDALVVFKINNVQRVNGEASALLREFGVAEQAPEMADPLAAFQAQTGLREGLNLDGSAAVYLANGEMGGDEPPLVLLIPVSDYKAFLGNFAALQDEGEGVSRVKFREAGEEEVEGEPDFDAYVMQMGEYAALTPTRELLKKPEKAITFSGVTAQMLQERDVVAYVNFEQVGPMLLQRLQDENAREQAKEEMRQSIAENQQFAKFQPVVEVAIDQMFQLAENFLRDASAAAGTMDLSDEGVRFGMVGQFKPGSYFARLFGQVNASGDLPLSGLPEANYILFGGAVDNQAANQQFFTDVLGPVVEQLRKTEGTEKLVEYVEATQAQMSAVGESRFGMLAPSGPLGGAPLFQQIYIQGGDVQKLKQSQRRMAELQPEIMAELMPDAGDMGAMGMGMVMNYEENAKQVADVSFDKLSTNMDDQAQQMNAMPLRMMFGPEGPVTYLGEVNDRLVIVSGLADTQIAQVVEAVRDNSSPLAEDQGVQFSRRHLIERQSAIFFFRPDELVRSGLGYARQMGMAVPIELPENLPPAAFAVGPAENAYQGDAFLPKDLISALIVAGLQAQQHFGGMGEDMPE